MVHNDAGQALLRARCSRRTTETRRGQLGGRGVRAGQQDQKVGRRVELPGSQAWSWGGEGGGCGVGG